MRGPDVDLAPRGGAPSRRGLPTDQLRELAERVAGDRARWDHHVPDGVPEERWYVRLAHDDEVEVWLLGWGVTHATELHDHGSSRGAFHVVEGRLVEERVDDAGRTVRRTLAAGHTVGIERGDVHDVASPGPAASLSVHVYSPPLTSMTFYEADGGLRPSRTVAVAGPDDEATW